MFAPRKNPDALDIHAVAPRRFALLSLELLSRFISLSVHFHCGLHVRQVTS